MNKPVMMVSLPNSGTTWLAQQIVNAIPGCRYYQEFFNPLRNEKYEHILVERFGCELMSCFKNIVTPGSDRVVEDIDRTWGQEDYHFTKEVFSPLKISSFCQRFNVFVLDRETTDVFPPTKLRAWSFYEHAWYALRESGAMPAGITVRERAVQAHKILRGAMIHEARENGCKVLKYAYLTEGSSMEVLNELRKEFDEFLAMRIADKIMASRTTKRERAHG